METNETIVNETVEPESAETAAPALTPEEQAHKREGASAMVLGIVGDVLVWYPLLGIAGLILSIVALVKANHNRDYALRLGLHEHGTNVAGRWCGIGGIIVGAVMLVIYLAAFAVVALFAVGIVQNSGILTAVLPH